MAGRGQVSWLPGFLRRAFPGNRCPPQWLAPSARDVLFPVTVAGPRRFLTGLPLTTDRIYAGESTSRNFRPAILVGAGLARVAAHQFSGPREGKMRRGMRLPSPALVVAGLALFVALSGTVYAAKKGRINGKVVKAKSLPGNRVKPRSIPTNRLKPGVLKKVAAQAGPITGAEIVELSLDQVPEAAHAKADTRRAPPTPKPRSTPSTRSTRRR